MHLYKTLQIKDGFIKVILIKCNTIFRDSKMSFGWRVGGSERLSRNQMNLNPAYVDTYLHMFSSFSTDSE